jgi:lysozyme family protein
MHNYDDRFNKAVEVVLRHEGGFSDNPDDPGKATNFGISTLFLKDNNIDLDVKSLTKEQAIDIYYQYWWDKYDYDLIRNADVATKIFDLSVNVGSFEAHKIVQRAINLVGLNRTAVDGIMGKKTIKLLNFTNDSGKSNILINNIKNEAAKFYTILVNNSPNLHCFLKGWLNRLND